MTTSAAATGLVRSPRIAAIRRVFRPAERVYFVFTLLVVSGGVLWILQPPTDADPAGADPVAHQVLLPIYAVMTWIIASSLKRVIRVALRGLPVLILTGVAILSTIWSAEPEVSLRRGIGLLAPTALGIVLAARLTTEELTRLLAWALGICAVLSVIVALGMPEIGISTIEYGSAWKGVYGHKNGLGKAMALGVALFTLLALDRRTHRWLTWLAVGLCSALVVLSKSATALVIAAGVLALIPLYRSLRLRATLSLALWTLAILLGTTVLTAVLANAEPVLAALGRDTSLTGRTDLWVVVLASIAEEPWLGYGYNAFWVGSAGASGTVLRSVGWETPHAHNGLLDLGLELGVVGVLLFLIGFGLAVRDAVRCARVTGTVTGLWPLVFLTFMLLANSSESNILRPHNVLWILYVAVLCSDLLADARARAAGEQLTGAQPWPATMAPVGPASPGVRRLSRRKRYG